MSFRRTLRTLLKRGALVAAANWPVALIQSIADGLFTLTVLAPLVGGIILVALVVGADTAGLERLSAHQIAASLVTALLAHRVVLAAFLLALGLAIVGGSLFVFLFKGGTVGVLVRGERQVPEPAPGEIEVLTAAAAFSIERFTDSARALFPRYARLWFVRMGVYLVSIAAYLGVTVASLGAERGWWVTSLVTVVFVVWIQIVNVVYLLVQIVIATDDCGVTQAVQRAGAFLHHERRLVIGVVGVILGLVLLAWGASLLAITALGLILLIPLAWLAAVPLQLLAFVLRALVFQYIELSSIGAYLALYRQFSERVDVGSRRVDVGTHVVGAMPSARPFGGVE